MNAHALLALCLAWTPLITAASAMAESTDAKPPASEAAAAAPERRAPAERLSVIVLDLTATTSTPEVARLVTDLVAVSLQRTARLEVLTSEDVRSVMTLEAEKEAIGCEDASCLAELAGALGAALVVHGSVGQLGELFVVNLNLFDSRVARSAGRESAQVRDRADLPGAIDTLVRALVGGIVELSPASSAAEPAPGPVASSDPAAFSPWLSPLFLGGATVGVLAGIGAATLGAWALVLDGEVAKADRPYADRARDQETGVGVIVGASALTVAAVGAAAIASLPFFE